MFDNNQLLLRNRGVAMSNLMVPSIRNVAAGEEVNYGDEYRRNLIKR